MTTAELASAEGHAQLEEIRIWSDSRRGREGVLSGAYVDRR
jgi:hypothetical protein